MILSNAKPNTTTFSSCFYSNAGWECSTRRAVQQIAPWRPFFFLFSVVLSTFQNISGPSLLPHAPALININPSHLLEPPVLDYKNSFRTPDCTPFRLLVVCFGRNTQACEYFLLVPPSLHLTMKGLMLVVEGWTNETEFIPILECNAITSCLAEPCPKMSWREVLSSIGETIWWRRTQSGWLSFR